MRRILIVALGIAIINAGVSYLMVTKLRPSFEKQIDDFGAYTGSVFVNIDKEIATEKSERLQFQKIVEDALTGMQDTGLIAMHWWCWQDRCERTEADCKQSIEHFSNAAIQAGRVQLGIDTRLKAACGQLGLAYCSGEQCFGAFEICERAADIPRLCRGVL